ncbi:MAG TPA: serine/threonine-protein kinase [Thermoanaerobaculia bacterium]|jgi:serine/threonine-protein kinase|nr:serine/threonine-protein kinase [Thermoanaerobaculia bacterium]
MTAPAASMVLAKEIEATYEVLSKMGEGGMGAVYKVRHRFFDEVRVIKVMQAEIEAVDELKERFLGEAKRGKQLRHPNLAEVIDFSVAADGTSYMVMEYIEGVNLRELMTRNNAPLDYQLLIPIAEQVLSALGYLHDKRFVHRDISPDNIMLTNDSDSSEPRVKLIDLGIAKSLESTTKHLTMVGKFIGKVQYASPEQFSGLVDGRSDLYSFGVVLYELLTGAKPITGKDYFAILNGHLSRPPRSFAETDPGNRVPAVIREALLKALAKRPEDRFQTAAEFAEALHATVARSEQRTVEMPYTTPFPELPAVTEVTKTSLPRWYPAAAIVAIVLLIVVALFWRRSSSKPAVVAVATVAPVPSTVAIEVPSVAESGQLLINAFPWGRVISVRDASGAEQLSGGETDTPLVLSLPPGVYQVTLMNPNSNRRASVSATVTANGVARAEVELDRIDAARYVDSIGIGR